MSTGWSNFDGIGDEIHVPIPADDDGFMGRECPDQDCLGYFKVKPGTGLTGEDLPCFCPYCGSGGPHNTFWTPEQIEYARSIALRQITEAIRKDLKGFEFDHKPRGAFGIGISMKLQPGPPVPIRHYREKQLETHVTCESCTLAYAVYGLFGFCPDCRTHNSFQILGRNLQLVEKQVNLAEELQDPDFRRHLIEDALENCVSAFDGFGRETCRVAAARLNVPEAASVSFQNLTVADQRLEQYFAFRLSDLVSQDEWEKAFNGFMKRHLIAHRSGVVDQQYLKKTKDNLAHVGRRVPISVDEVRAISEVVRKLGGSLVSELDARSV